MHIHLKKGDPAIHASQYSSMGDDEHETIIKRGTKLKYHGTTTYGRKQAWADNYQLTHVHHFTVAKNKKDVSEGLAPKKIDNATILKHNNGPPLPKKKKATLPTIKNWADHQPHSTRVSPEEAKKVNPEVFKYNKEGEKFKHADKWVAGKVHAAKLAKKTPITNQKHKEAINDYTASSSYLNHKLKTDGTRSLGFSSSETVKHLDAAIEDNRAKESRHVYHGAGFDPRPHISKSGHFKTPAYLSASHDKEKAHTFADRHDIQSPKHNAEVSKNPRRNRERQHILHIHVKKGDPALYVDHHSNYKGEHETIIKRNVPLKYHGTTHYFSKRKYSINHGTILHVHHFTIDEHHTEPTSPETHIKSLHKKD